MALDLWNGHLLVHNGLSGTFMGEERRFCMQLNIQTYNYVRWTRFMEREAEARRQ